MTSDINALPEELKIDSAYLWGHSDGAILGLLLAMDHPKKVKKLLAFGANIQPDNTAMFQWTIDHDKKIVKESSDIQHMKLCQLILDYPNIPFSSLLRISIPVLVMAGDHDAIRPEHTLKIFQSIPNSQLCILPGSTHTAAWEKVDTFLNFLYDFLDRPFTMPNTGDSYHDN
jgi:pimeloyl-ACP methyl ester carboxylesterase